MWGTGFNGILQLVSLHGAAHTAKVFIYLLSWSIHKWWVRCCSYGKPGAYLCLATTTDPTAPYPGNWTRYGKVFGASEASNTKSGALLIRPQPPHYLYWGVNTIHLAGEWSQNYSNNKKGQADDDIQMPDG